MNEPESPLKPKRRRINWDNPDDVKAVVIAAMGMSNECVRYYCGDYSAGQIYYRMKLAHMNRARMDFRNGRSWIAKRFIQQNASAVEARIDKMVHKPHQTDDKQAP